MTPQEITEMPKFTGDRIQRTCAKCGCHAGMVFEHKSWTYLVTMQVIEAILNTCKRCGYTWYEKTVDAR